MKPGDRVAYSVQFLKSIGCSHGQMAHARGKIASIKNLGELAIATIQWDNMADLPEKVNVKNLAIVGPNRRFANCD